MDTERADQPPRHEEDDDFFFAAGAPPPPPRGRAFDLSVLFVLLDGLRRAAPRDVEVHLTNLIREFLLTLRSLIDWYLERLDRPRREPQVEDIPID